MKDMNSNSYSNIQNITPAICTPSLGEAECAELIDHISLGNARNSTRTGQPQGGPSKIVTDQDWVVVLWDKDHTDTAPWNVQAKDRQSATAKARSQWWRWLRGDQGWDRDDGTLDPGLELPVQPEVYQVYRCSWIGEHIQ